MGFAIFFLILSGLLILFIGIMIFALVKGDGRTKPAIPIAFVLLAVTLFFGIRILSFNLTFEKNFIEIFDEATEDVLNEEFSRGFKVTDCSYNVDDFSLNGLLSDHNSTIDTTWNFTVELNNVKLETVQKDLLNYVRDVYPLEIQIDNDKTADLFDLTSKITIYVNDEKYVEKTTGSSFTNDYGTPSTTCSKSGCTKKIASSGDTAYCPSHSGRCLNCRCYVDPDAMYCMDCLRSALE